MLNPAVEVDVDIMFGTFDDGPGFPDPPYSKDMIASLEKAELLPGWYDEWIIHGQERIREFRVGALETMADRCLKSGDVRTAIDASLAAIAVDPLRESAHERLIQGHLAAGNRASAHRVYGNLHSRLDEELGILPSAQLKSLITDSTNAV
ncbi:BTAD domain-containing putative transcriptional regulator [Arthrobacter sp. GCM10027362]|uniref:AfsR/SARP family transcriptional regulator n=1 Tax=Arthrobacter sp. GCM10027362 TaxID=3273379 RepID=UPI003626CDD1